MKPIQDIIKEFRDNDDFKVWMKEWQKKDIQSFLTSTLEARDKEWTQKIIKIIDDTDGLMVSTAKLYEIFTNK